MIENSIFIFKPYSDGVKYGIGSYINTLIKSKQKKCIFYIVELFFPECKKIHVTNNANNIIIKIPLLDDYKIVNGCTTDVNTCKSIWGILSEYISSNNNVFHFQTPFLFNLIKLIHNSSNNHKIIYTFHKLRWKYYFNCHYDIFTNIMNQNIRNSYIDFVRLTLNEEKKICTLCFKIIVLTNKSKKFVIEEYGISKEKVCLIRNGLKLENNIMPIKSKGKHFSFLFVGRLCEEKGLSYLIRAFDEFTLKHSNTRLFIAGEGDKPELKLKNKSKVIFLGHVNKTRLKNLYKKCDVGLIPSLNEECSYVALEMMHSGIPIICSSLGGLDEIFTNNLNALKIKHYYDEQGILRLDIVDFELNMKKLYENEKLGTKLSKNAFSLLKRNYNNSTMIQKTNALYLEN